MVIVGAKHLMEVNCTRPSRQVTVSARCGARSRVGPAGESTLAPVQRHIEYGRVQARAVSPLWPIRCRFPSPASWLGCPRDRAGRIDATETQNIEIVEGVMPPTHAPRVHSKLVAASYACAERLRCRAGCVLVKDIPTNATLQWHLVALVRTLSPSGR